MHQSAWRKMQRAIRDFVPDDRHLTVVDFGSGTNQKKWDEGMTHRHLLEEMGYDAEVVGVDVVDRLNVDVVMPKPYRVPLKSNSVDLVLSGQVFEHIPFPWASTMEIARLLKPGGLFIMTVPSRGHPHTGVDCWRYYDDAIRALAAYAGLKVRRARTDHPSRKDGPGRVFELIDNVDVPGYWGDTIGVLEKPVRYPSRRVALIRGPLLWWANRRAQAFTSSVEHVGTKRRREGRRGPNKSAGPPTPG